MLLLIAVVIYEGVLKQRNLSISPSSFNLVVLWALFADLNLIGFWVDVGGLSTSIGSWGDRPGAGLLSFVGF